jgi:P2-related tail formation protein
MLWLSQILQAVVLAPANPIFTHYLFETIGALIKVLHLFHMRILVTEQWLQRYAASRHGS